MDLTLLLTFKVAIQVPFTDQAGTLGRPCRASLSEWMFVRQCCCQLPAARLPL